MSIRLAKRVVFIAALSPLVLLIWGALAHRLGANPIAVITHDSGTWTLRFLVLTLAVTPVRRVTGWNGVTGVRRPLGLFAFFYGTLHFVTYVWLDQFFDLPGILKDIVKRPFITAGTLAFVLMVPLAMTSTASMITRLGGRTWQRLHRLVYVSAVAGVVHYWWLVKADTRRPMAYAAIVTTLLTLRLVWIRRSRRRPLVS
jgi:sulfoxide reductase heme-binding subunit YedZ